MVFELLESHCQGRNNYILSLSLLSLFFSPKQLNTDFFPAIACSLCIISFGPSLSTWMPPSSIYWSDGLACIQTTAMFQNATKCQDTRTDHEIRSSEVLRRYLTQEEEDSKMYRDLTSHRFPIWMSSERALFQRCSSTIGQQAMTLCCTEMFAILERESTIHVSHELS